MAKIVYGEFDPTGNAGTKLLAQFVVPAIQMSGTVTGLICGINAYDTGSLGVVTNNYNQAPWACPFGAVLTNSMITTYGAAPTAGSLTFMFNGVSSGAQAFSLFTLTNVLNIATTLGLNANTRYTYTINSSGWTQATNAGIHIQLYGYYT